MRLQGDRKRHSWHSRRKATEHVSTGKVQKPASRPTADQWMRDKQVPVAVGQPLIYTGIQKGKQVYDGVAHYTMSMEHDIRVFLEDVGMAQVREITAPMPTKLEILSDDRGVSEQEHVEYRAKVGSLSWFVGCRDDIAYEVSRLAQYLATPTKGALKALRRVIAS